MTEKIEKWGTTEDGYVIFYNQALEELCSGTGFSKKSFLSWAVKRGIVLQDSAGKSSRQKKVNGKNMRCVYIKIPDATNRMKMGKSIMGMVRKLTKMGFCSWKRDSNGYPFYMIWGKVILCATQGVTSKTQYLCGLRGCGNTLTPVTQKNTMYI